MKRYLFVAFCIIFGYSTKAQMLSNQGALVSVKGGFVSVHGDVMNANAGTFHNSDTIIVYGDWENRANNEAFTSLDDGVLRLVGDTQTVKGTSITRFYELWLENTGVKYGEIDVYVNDWLRLNDREFNLDTNVVHVFNTDLDAVETTFGANWGFVSSLQDGGLLRHTANTQTYFYPVGSAIAPARFRPVNISPQSNAAAAYRVRMANVDATAENYDRALREFELCEVNPTFYHRIAQTAGSDAATVGIYHDQSADGTWKSLGKWGMNAWWEWVDTGLVTFNSTYNLDVLSSANPVTNFNPTPFALVDEAPPIGLTIDATPMCSDDTLSLLAFQSADFSTYDFYIDTVLVASQTAPDISIPEAYQTQLAANDYQIWVVGSTPECGRSSDTTTVTVYQSPTAQASPDTIIVLGTNANIYASGGDFYEWQPDATLTCPICPQTEAQPTETTTFTVMVESLDGCTDSDTVQVIVQENVGQVVFIPNALTPNNDGKNDTWFIKNIQLFPSNVVKILNRWGDVVYESAFYNNDWDGSFAGGQLPSGTYYYILDLGAGWGIFKGPVTIIRPMDE